MSARSRIHRAVPYGEGAAAVGLVECPGRQVTGRQGAHSRTAVPNRMTEAPRNDTPPKKMHTYRRLRSDC